MLGEGAVGAGHGMVRLSEKREVFGTWEFLCVGHLCGLWMLLKVFEMGWNQDGRWKVEEQGFWQFLKPDKYMK